MRENERTGTNKQAHDDEGDRHIYLYRPVPVHEFGDRRLHFLRDETDVAPAFSIASFASVIIVATAVILRGVSFPLERDLGRARFVSNVTTGSVQWTPKTYM